MRSEEEKFLFNRIYDDFYVQFPQGAHLSELIDAFNCKKILLQFSEKEGTKVINEECVKEIKKTVPYIQRIVEKPRSFIKSIEEKVPVATAKRINSGAIMHLGRDSNDWYARTFLTVKPKNIISDINEETIELYENRFIKTLIDRILIYVVARRVKLENLYEQEEDDNIRNYLSNNYIKVQSNSDILLKTLLRNSHDNSSVGFKSKLSEELDEIKALERKIINLRYSDFYSKLRKCRKVGNPIAKTNIVMFDANYNRCYKLWEYLNSEHQEEDYSYDVQLEMQYASYYFAYVVFNIIASMYNSGFKELNNPKFDVKDDMLTASGDLLWEKGNTKLKAHIVSKNKKVVFSLLLDEQKDKWDIFEIYSDFTNFEGKGRAQVEDLTTVIIENLIKRDKKSSVSSKYCFVSLDINACSANSNDFGEMLYRRLFNIGDNYSKDELNLNDKGNYKTGIQILSPLDLRYNFLHIQRIINSHILRNKDFKTMPTVCPLCGSGKVRTTPDHIDCYECRHRISITKCANCGEQHLLWVKYIDDSALKKPEITDTVKEKPYYYQLMKYETIMGQYAISSFRLEEEVTGWKLKSICPKCGVVLGDTENRAND